MQSRSIGLLLFALMTGLFAAATISAASLTREPPVSHHRHDKKSPSLGEQQQQRRDLQTIQVALSDINAALAQVDAALVHSQDNAAVLLRLAPLTMDVLEAIQYAQARIRASPATVSLANALDLQATTESLAANTALTVGDLVRNQHRLAAPGVGRQVAFGLRMLKRSSVRLAQTIADQVPAELAYVSARAVQALEDTFDRGIAAFDRDDGRGGGGDDGPTGEDDAERPPSMPTGEDDAGTPPSMKSLPGPSTSSNPSVPDPPSESFGGVASSLTVPGTFVPGQSCFCVCPAMAPCDSGPLLNGP